MYVHLPTTMKQLHSQFFEDKEYQRLVRLKEKKGWTWKELILSVLKTE